MAAICAQVVFDALLVADVDEYLLEDACPRTVCRRDRKTTLQHVLQESYRLEADALAARIRATNDEDALPFCQSDGERHNLCALFL